MSLDEALSGRTVVVTGAASGIGARTVARLAEAGARVIAIDRASLPPAREESRTVQMDVTIEESWEKLARDLRDRFGHVDGLVSAAGIIRMGAITETTLDDFRQIMAVNVEGVFLGMKHILPLMLDRGEGSVVNISSTAGIAGAPMASAYSASKGAVRMMSKSVALEMIAQGSRIRVNSLHPALTETPMVASIIEQLGGGDEVVAALKAQLPSSRLMTVDAIVDAIIFLLSDHAASINGTEFAVDNGFTA